MQTPSLNPRFGAIKVECTPTAKIRRFQELAEKDPECKRLIDSLDERGIDVVFLAQGPQDKTNMRIQYPNGGENIEMSKTTSVAGYFAAVGDAYSGYLNLMIEQSQAEFKYWPSMKQRDTAQ